MVTPVYISLGSDCSIAYQLQVRNLRHMSFPFDWVKTNNLIDILALLNNNFQFLTDPAYLEIVRESDKFPLLEENWIDASSRNLVLKHKKYNILFPHEIKYTDDTKIIDQQIFNMCEKYNRRIARFLEILKDREIKKIFIRITDKKEIPELLLNTLRNITNNFELKFIKLDKTMKFSCWKKNEYNWAFLFNSISP